MHRPLFYDIRPNVMTSRTPKMKNTGQPRAILKVFGWHLFWSYLSLIGVSDKTRTLEGVDQHTEKLNELLRIPFDFCNPSIPVTCSYLPCKDKDGNENRILLMEIPASSSLHTKQADEAFMRVGDKSRKLTFDDRSVFESPGKLRWPEMLMHCWCNKKLKAPQPIWL